MDDEWLDTLPRVKYVHSMFEKEAVMARNTGDDYRKGAVTGRTQFQHENGDWQKRNERNGQFMERKSTEGPFKGVAKEPDGRDTKNS